MNLKAILDGKSVKLVNDLVEWATWFEKANVEGWRRVGEDKNDKTRVSTVFLGLDHGYGNGSPLWFETCVFDSKDPTSSKVVERYTTWEKADLGHKHWVAHYFGTSK